MGACTGRGMAGAGWWGNGLWPRHVTSQCSAALPSMHAPTYGPMCGNDVHSAHAQCKAGGCGEWYVSQRAGGGCMRAVRTSEGKDVQ